MQVTGPAQLLLLALDLSHQTKHINDAPSLHDLAIGELVEGHHSASDLFACRWDAHKRARVSAAQRRSLCDHVSFGNHGLDREAEVRKALTEPDKAVSYTHLRAHETVLDLVCRL